MNRLAIPAALAAGEACGFVCFWFGPAWIAAAALSLTVVFFGHGFGLRSIQSIAETYSGMASVQTENGLFKLTVILRPEQKKG